METRYYKFVDTTLWEVRINGRIVKLIRGGKAARHYAEKCTGNLFNDRKEVLIICRDTGIIEKIA